MSIRPTPPLTRSKTEPSLLLFAVAVLLVLLLAMGALVAVFGGGLRPLFAASANALGSEEEVPSGAVSE
ncbi:MAG: hypothetical protein HY901_31055 [Deltaproteobacteria bacterium]|nr:hypothetical protein [Deltaproteobacteria bacterium]